MTDLESVRKFEYRPCRIAAGFDVEFTTGGQSFQGVCGDVSNAGVRVKFDGQVAAGSSGLLILHHPRSVLELQAHVVYTDQDHVGLAFEFQTPWEVEATTEYIAAISNSKAAPVVFRFP